jgi:hypothetical protein
MSSTRAASNGASGTPPVPLRFEVTLLAVSDVDRGECALARPRARQGRDEARA